MAARTFRGHTIVVARLATGRIRQISVKVPRRLIPKMTGAHTPCPLFISHNAQFLSARWRTGVGVSGGRSVGAGIMFKAKPLDTPDFR